MNIPRPVGTKLTLYALTCHEMLMRSAHLWKVIHEGEEQSVGKPKSVEDCFACLDLNLRTFLQDDRTEEADLIALFESELQGAIHRCGGAGISSQPETGRHVTAIFQDIAAAVRARAAALARPWDPAALFEPFHAQGRALAAAFFQGSPHPTPRLARYYALQCGYERKKGQDVPMSCLEEDEEVYFNFTLEDGFKDFVACLFLFLHEYTAHIFTYDNSENDRFHDGWMMHAAYHYLTRQWLRADLAPFAFTCTHCKTRVEAPVSGLDRTQVLLDDYLNRHLSTRSFTYDAYLFTSRFREWLGDDPLFLRMTHELAHFQPLPNEPSNWQTRFMNRLQDVFEDATLRGQLRGLLSTHTTVRALWPSLAQLAMRAAP